MVVWCEDRGGICKCGVAVVHRDEEVNVLFLDSEGCRVTISDMKDRSVGCCVGFLSNCSLCFPFFF